MAKDLGECIDTLDNLNGALQLPMPAAFHVEQLKIALPELLAEFKAAYADAVGEDPWPEEVKP